jgi:peptidoglycan/xylan/chitin deacetylase (PgdA/CDA1 family)
MYHELRRPGVPLCEDEPGYLRYVLDESVFRRQLQWIGAAGLRGIAVGESLQRGLDSTGRVAITFDDGCRSDWTIAAPLLLEHRFGATFYVVAGWVGTRRGFAAIGELRQLHEAGFEIGSHSMSHAFLTDLDAAGLRREVVDSKAALEDLLGAPVRHFSCPGGRWTRRAADLAREAGYESVATSRLGANGPAADRYALRRCAIRRGDPPGRFEAYCRAHGLWGARTRERLLTAARTLLGTRLYVGLRTRALGGPAGPRTR